MDPECPCTTRTCPQHGFCKYCVAHHREINDRIAKKTGGVGQGHAHFCKRDPIVTIGDLPVGARIRDYKSDEIFLIAAQNHPGYPGTTLISDRVLSLACFDAAEPDSVCEPRCENAYEYGSNDYATSNVNTWLNSRSSDWYAPKHATDNPPKAEFVRWSEQPNFNMPGFLVRFSKHFVAALVETDVPVVKRTERDKAELTTIKTKVFLPSRTELGKGDELGMAEGAPLPLFGGSGGFGFLKTGASDKQRELHGRSWNPGRPGVALDAPQIYDPKFGWWYWMRTPHPRYNFMVRVMTADNAVSYTYANNDVVGIRPMLVMKPETKLFKTVDQDKLFTYSIVQKEAIIPTYEMG
jgi:hypothetical protein